MNFQCRKILFCAYEVINFVVTARATIKDFDASINIHHLDAYEQARRAIYEENVRWTDRLYSL